jgi:tetratricopeptide (TPR) repeat protein
MPNVLGLFDVHGNVMEWCYGGPHDEGVNDRHFVTHNARRAVIGGHCDDSSSRLGIYLAQHAVPGNRRQIVHGFRVARTLVPAGENPPAMDEAERDWETAHWLGRQGKWEDAANLTHQALPHRADDLNTWQRLPRIWLFLGEVDKANAVCDQMLRRFGDTQDPDAAHLLAGMCLSIPGRETTGQVERLTELAVQVNNPTHYRDMGKLLYRQGKFEEAEPWLQKATYVYPRGRPATYYFLAMTLHQLGDQAGAQDAFEEALRFRAQIRQGFSVGDYGEYWHHWLLTEAIRREAEQVLGVD